ncbi:MAG: DUF2339 domain-containing protein [Elusimicrobia bacterium]|nr:DUF2339 domain-containing protein [Elusimicrobiota bacterium]
MDDIELQSRIADMQAELERRRFEARRVTPTAEAPAQLPPPPPLLPDRPCPVCRVPRPPRGPCPGCSFENKPRSPRQDGILDTAGAFLARLGANVKELGFERFLAERLFAYVGMLLVVLGGAFFLKYAAEHSGPWGRVAVGVVSGLGVAACGEFLRRRPRFTNLSVPVTAGGWALLTYTAYAAHAVEASKVVADPRLGLVLLVAAAGGMIGHSLLTGSRLMTAFAFAASYFAFAATEFGPQTLAVCTVLGLAAAWTSRRLRSPELVPIGLVGFAVNYWPTLQQAFAGPSAPRLLLDLGAAAAVYGAMAVAAPDAGEDERAAAWTDASLSFGAVLLGITVHAQSRFLLPELGAAAGLTAAGLFSVLSGRAKGGAARTIQGFLGAASAALAVWRLPGLPAQTWGFVLSSSALALSGLRLRRESFERYALALAGLGALTFLAQGPAPDVRLACALPVGLFGLAAYALAGPSRPTSRVWLHTGLAGAAAGLWCWSRLDPALRLPVLALGSLGLLWLGRGRDALGADLRAQGYLLAAAVPVQAALVAAPSGVCAGAAALLLLAPLSWAPWAKDAGETVEERGAAQVFAALSLTLLVLFAARTAAGTMVTLCWTALGGVYLAGGLAARRPELRRPALAVLGLCAWKAFMVDLVFLPLPYRVLSMTALGLLMVLCSVAYVRLVKDEPPTLALGEEGR